MNNISLNQGKQFNNYQKKIYRKEGFTNKPTSNSTKTTTKTNTTTTKTNTTNTNTTNTTTTNQKDLDDFNQLQSKFNDLMLQYTTIQKTINDKSLEHVSRISSNNPYLNKYLLFTDGTVVYVTKQGIAKPFTNEDILNSVFGKNGCPPKDYIKLDIPWSSEYIVGTTIPTNPSLIVGSPMVSGQSCGNEGSNVVSSTLINNPTSEYIGCYNANSNNDNMTFIGGKPENTEATGTYTYDKCMDAAIQDGYQYFALQNVNTETSTGYCAVSNDLSKIQSYGDATTKYNIVALWSSNTVTNEPNSVQLSGTGQLTIQNSDGSFIYNVNPVVSGCENWGTLTIDSATYGGNCSVPIGNVTSQVATDLKCNWNTNCSIPISNQTFGDPAPGCAKSFDIVYKCGGTAFTRNLATAEGQTMILDCNEYMETTCQFHLLLNDNGNMAIYKGADPSKNNGEIWSTSTNGKQINNNPDWVASKGKYGRNYLKTGEVLATNEWIGSTNGSTILIMQEDGNLVLYTSEKSKGCKKINDKMFGGQLVNSVYKLNARANIDNLGKIGYVNSDSQLKQYPDSMLKFTNEYTMYKNTNSNGNDLTSLIVKDQLECETACNDNADCGGYVYNNNISTCWLKKHSNFSKHEDLETVFGIRNRATNGSKNCNNKIVNIDSVQYGNYVVGPEMTTETECNQSFVSHEDKVALEDIKSQLSILGQDIATRMEELYNEDNKINEKLNMNAEQFNKDLEKYRNISAQLQEERNLQSNNIEGMTNYLDMNDLNGMLTDSDLLVLQQNSQYIMWSILAVGLLTITINTMK